MARHPSQFYKVVALVVDPNCCSCCCCSPSPYQDSTDARRQEAAVGHPDKIRSDDGAGRGGAGEAHQAEPGEEGQEERTGKDEEERQGVSGDKRLTEHR